MEMEGGRKDGGGDGGKSVWGGMVGNLFILLCINMTMVSYPPF